MVPAILVRLMLLQILGTTVVGQSEAVNFDLLKDAVGSDQNCESLHMLQARASVKQLGASNATAKARISSIRVTKLAAAATSHAQLMATLILIAAVLILAVFNIYRAHKVGLTVIGKDVSESDSRPRLGALDVAKFVLINFVNFTHIYPALHSAPTVPDSGEKEYDAITSWYYAFMLPAFSFLSGMFGSSISCNSLSKALLFTIGSNGFCILLAVIPGSIVSDPSAWFLWSLLSWRLIISPLFNLAGRCKMPYLVTFSFLHCLLFVLSCLTFPGKPGTIKSGLDHVYQEISYVYGRDLIFTAFFAVGLYQPPAAWHAVLSSSRSCYVSLCYLVMWFFLDVQSPAWLQKWASLDPEVSQVTVQSFLTFTIDFMWVLGLVFAVLNFIVVASTMLSRRLPLLISVVEGWGTRTLYAYVLGRLLFHIMQAIGVPELMQEYHDIRLLATIIGALLTTALLCGDGTRVIFHWVMEPYWILDCLSKPSGDKISGNSQPLQNDDLLVVNS